jgi:hypothetical protein
MALSAAAALAAAAGAVAWLDARSKAAKPELVFDPNCEFTTTVLSRCPTLKSEYRPVPLLTNPHVRQRHAQPSRGASAGRRLSGLMQPPSAGVQEGTRCSVACPCCGRPFGLHGSCHGRVCAHTCSSAAT